MIQHKQTYTHSYIKDDAVNDFKVCTAVPCRALLGRLFHTEIELISERQWYEHQKDNEREA